MDEAPLFNAAADGPDGGAAWWLRAADGARLRIGVWPEGKKGTVLLFPGRTEYIEKYGRAARDLRARGYATVSIDWRGQGLADRHPTRPMLGWVPEFADYQKDVQALMAALPALDLPRPFHLLAHSMGGCIGLRALMEGMQVASAAFTGPMWDINMTPAVRFTAGLLTGTARALGFRARYAPGTSGDDTYVAVNGFDGNELTTDPEMYRYMQDQAAAHPELTLGGPGVVWVNEALRETAALARRASPATPTLTFLGSDETIVLPAAIRQRMARWPDGRLIEVEGARHEVMMEGPGTRAMVFDACAALFDSAR